jgi:hypothetical protein
VPSPESCWLLASQRASGLGCIVDEVRGRRVTIEKTRLIFTSLLSYTHCVHSAPGSVRYRPPGVSYARSLITSALGSRDSARAAPAVVDLAQPAFRPDQRKVVRDTLESKPR